MPIQVSFSEALGKMGAGLADALRDYQQGTADLIAGKEESLRRRREFPEMSMVPDAKASWIRSFTDEEGEAGANKAAFLRNLAAVRPEWSEKKLEKFYRTQVEPEVLHTLNTIDASGFSSGSHFRPSPFGDVGEIKLKPARPRREGRGFKPGRDEWYPTVSHEFGHAADFAIKRALLMHKLPGGEYGDVGGDLLRRNEEAMEGAFPFMGQRSLPGILESIPRDDKPGVLPAVNRAVRGALEGTVGLPSYHLDEGFTHSRTGAELRNSVRDLRRHLGRDPTPDEIKKIVLSDVSNMFPLSPEGDWRRDTAEEGYTLGRPTAPLRQYGAFRGTEGGVHVRDMQRHYKPRAEDVDTGSLLQPYLSEGWGEEDPDASFYPEGYEPLAPEVSKELLPGTPSPEDIAGALREISYAEPLEGALTRAFG